FHVAGLPTTWGNPKFTDWKAEVDALAVQRLKAAGAIVIGKTNVPLGLSDSQSYNDIYGTTNNPWDLTRTPGGSSGGSAAVLAAPDELLEGIGYKLALPQPRRDKLADFRVLVIDKHPLCPTAKSVAGPLNDLAERLAKHGCKVMRDSPKLPDLELTARIHRELLSAFFSADLPPDIRERVEAAAKVLSHDDQSLAAAQLRGLTLSHPEWIRKSRIRDGLRARWQGLFQDV